MEIRLDDSMKALGVEAVVVGIARNVNPNANLEADFLTKQAQTETWALDADIEQVKDHPFIKGYYDMMQAVGRSVKKNPPTIPAFIENIQRRGSIPKINSIVDIYNVESLRSMIAIGGHDLDKITWPLTITVNQEEGSFVPISAKEKHVAATDYVYKDTKGIMAWMGVRDGEAYKFDDQTKNAIFIVQGNAAIDVEARVEALKVIEADLRATMPSLEFEILVIK